MIGLSLSSYLSTMSTDDQRLEEAQALFKAGKFEEAKLIFAELVERHPMHGVAWQGLGYVAGKQRQYERAVQYLAQAQQYLPPSLEIYVQLTYLSKLARLNEQALSWVEQGLRLAPRDYEALSYKTGILIELGRYEEAVAHIRQVLEIYPNDAQLYFQFGQISGVMGRLQDEEDAYRRALQIKPDALQVRVNLGVALRDQFKFDEALSQFNHVLKVDPNHAGARTNRAQLNLLLGNLPQGWKDYEWRWLDGVASHGIEGPRWQAPKSVKAAQSCKLLIHAEQGFGDTIQFSRYVATLNTLFPKTEIIFRVQHELVSFLRPNFPQINVQSAQDPMVEFDAHLPLLSAPFALEKYLQAIPALVSPFSVSEEKYREWGARLGVKNRGRVGLVWSGRPTHLNDKNRSVTLTHMLSLLSERHDFYSLQKEIRPQDQQVLSGESRLQSFGADLHDFSDTAALCQHMDLVISVDTSVAHLAASLGRPTWVMLPHLPDWRWQLNRSDTDWYDTVRLFRQASPGKWAEVIEQVKDALTQKLS